MREADVGGEPCCQLLPRPPRPSLEALFGSAAMMGDEEFIALAVELRWRRRGPVSGREAHRLRPGWPSSTCGLLQTFKFDKARLII